MSLIIPEPRFEMPELFEPGRKPVGPAVVDRSHWAGKHAQRVILPGRGVVNDLVTGDTAISFGNAFVNSKQNAEYDSGGDKHQFGFVTPVFSGITVMARVNRYADGIGNDMGVYSDMYQNNWTSNGVSINMRPTSSGFLFAAGTAYSYVDDTSIPIRTWINICGTWAGGEPLLYLNGELKTRTAGTSAASYSASTGGNARIGTYYDESTSRTLNGEIEYVFVFNKAFRAEDIRKIIAAPYQFLIPA